MIKSAMDLGCLDLGCVSVSDKRNGVGVSTDSPSRASKSGQHKSPRESSSLRKSQSKRSSQRKSSPLGWIPRKRGDSYLSRKIKKLQEVSGMNQTLDETLGDSNPHYCKIVREQMAVREAAGRAMELRKAAFVEASWCRILRAARIQSVEAETLMENAEKAAVEAFEAASALGVIMHDKPNSSRKQYRIETSHGGGSPTHTVTASFETAFDVDKEVAAAVKTAFARLANCPSLSKAEIKDLLRKISENPDVHDNHEITEVSSECGTESESELSMLHKVDEEEAESQEASSLKMRQLKVKRRQSFGKFSREKLVDMMLERLQGLQEDQLSSLASIVATCGLGDALAEVRNQRLQPTTSEPTISGYGNPSSMDTRTRRYSKCGSLNEGKTTSGNESQIPSLDKFLVKHMSKLEREVYEARKASKDVPGEDRKVSQGVSGDTAPDLGSILVKHSSRLEKEIEEAKKNAGMNSGMHQKNSSRNKTPLDPIPDLEGLLEKSSCALREEAGKENVDFTNKAEGHEESLDKIFVKPVHWLEREKNVSEAVYGNRKIQKRKQAATSESDYESLDKIMVKHVPKLEKEKLRFRAAVEEKENTKNNNEVSLNETVGEEKKPILTRRQVRDKEIQETWGGLGLGESKNNSQKRPESKKTEATEHLKELTRPVLTRRQARDKEMLEAWGGLGLGDSCLDQTVVNKRVKNPDQSGKMEKQQLKKETEAPLLTRRQARDKEMQEAWGGLDLGNSIRPCLSKLEREKAAWIKAEEEEKTRGN